MLKYEINTVRKFKKFYTRFKKSSSITSHTIGKGFFIYTNPPVLKVNILSQVLLTCIFFSMLLETSLKFFYCSFEKYHDYCLNLLFSSFPIIYRILRQVPTFLEDCQNKYEELSTEYQQFLDFGQSST